MMKKIFKIITLLTFFIFLSACFNDPKYKRTAFYRVNNVSISEQNNGTPDYHFDLKFDGKKLQESNKLKFDITFFTHLNEPIVEIYLNRSVLSYKNKKFNSLTDKEVLVTYKQIESTKAYFNNEPISIEFKNNKDLSFYLKENNKTKEKIDEFDSFEIIIPVKIEKMKTRNSSDRDEKLIDNFIVKDLKFVFKRDFEDGQRIIPSWYSAH